MTARPQFHEGQEVEVAKAWQNCPSTHCERSQECRSPHECNGWRKAKIIRMAPDGGVIFNPVYETTLGLFDAAHIRAIPNRDLAKMTHDELQEDVNDCYGRAVRSAMESDGTAAELWPAEERDDNTSGSMWGAVAGEGARLKRKQLEREISLVQDASLRSNLNHTISKLFMFLEDDLRLAIKEARRAP